MFNGKGTLLANGVCIEESYTKDVVPQKGLTKVYCGITNQTVRSVDSRGGTISIDFTIRMTWQDPRIKTKFTKEDMVYGGIALSNRAITNIWTPDLYILNRRTLYTTENWFFLKSAQILSSVPQMMTDKKNQWRQTF